MVLTWPPPTGAVATGGTDLTAFCIRYQRQSGCASCATDNNDVCTNSGGTRKDFTWGASGIGGGGGGGDCLVPVRPTAYSLRLAKGTTYVFQLAAVNGVGAGPFYPDNYDPSLAASKGLVCLPPYYSPPPKPTPFGSVFVAPWMGQYGPLYGAFPYSPSTAFVKWGAGGTTGDLVLYRNLTANGGREIEHIEIQRASRSAGAADATTPFAFPAGSYCPGPSPQTDSTTGATVFCVAKDVAATSAYVNKQLQDSTASNVGVEYGYRVRLSNVAVCGPSAAGTPDCRWSATSDVAVAQTPSDSVYTNVRAQALGSGSIQVRAWGWGEWGGSGWVGGWVNVCVCVCVVMCVGVGVGGRGGAQVVWVRPSGASQGVYSDATYGNYVNILYSPSAAALAAAGDCATAVAPVYCLGSGVTTSSFIGGSLVYTYGTYQVPPSTPSSTPTAPTRSCPPPPCLHLRHLPGHAFTPSSTPTAPTRSRPPPGNPRESRTLNPEP